MTDDTAYVLRTCWKDGISHGGFRWPKRGNVEATDWDPTPECGGGLHGLLDGQGDGTLMDWSEDARWQVVRVNRSECVRVGRKVKFPRGYVVISGTREEATRYLIRRGCTSVVASILTGGDRSILTGGYGSTLTGGDGSTLTGGDRSILTGGYGSTLTGGDDSILTGGDRSTLVGGYYSTLTGGDRSTLVGDDYSTLTGGDYSILAARHWDGSRFRIRVAYVGEDGIEAGVAYRVNDGGKWEAVA